MLAVESQEGHSGIITLRNKIDRVAVECNPKRKACPGCVSNLTRVFLSGMSADKPIHYLLYFG
ncbi:MAG: hypothetical protein K0R39_4642 [Symbiobacteriaceae bacterium]|nr:hypothetical protein [Symbiobacteriaceae bacterium]